MSNREITDAIIDRMVDGELNENEQRELLMACDQQPEHWREMALAYVESQTWRDEFSIWSAAAVEEDIVEEQKEESVLQLANAPARFSTRAGITPWRVLNVAAMLLLSLTVGYGIGTFEFPASKPSSSNIAISPNNKTNPAEQVVVWVPNQTGDGLNPMSVPVQNVGNLDSQQLAKQNQMSSEVLQALESKGHDVTRERTWHPVQLQDGRGAFVPTDNLNVQFTGYQ
ncbi:MAG: hypothetical protein P8N76_10065 [Pirellulaceae bacterium]|nr:hypothetical protein [Pirellulaceae bacterium]